MTSMRGTAWFFLLASFLALWVGALGTLRGVACAAVIPSHAAGDSLRAADLAKVQALLERKVVLQKLVDYGVSPRDAMDRIGSMSDRDLHRLAALSDRVAAGADSGVGFAIGVAILVILVLVILMLMNKRVVIR